MITKTHTEAIATLFGFQDELIQDITGTLDSRKQGRKDIHILELLCDSRQALYAALVTLGHFKAD